MTSTSPIDEFDAARQVVEALKGLKPEEQQRAMRYAQERLGFASPPAPPPGDPSTRLTGSDIATFIKAKNPSNDVQFAAAVAYYYAFDAPANLKKAEISGEDLQEAARLTSRKRLDRPITTLHNTVGRGYIDKGSTRGTFRINTVGENLVAMSLPTGATTAAERTTRRPARKK
jgi:hypothetical protein